MGRCYYLSLADRYSRSRHCITSPKFSLKFEKALTEHPVFGKVERGDDDDDDGGNEHYDIVWRIKKVCVVQRDEKGTFVRRRDLP